MKSFIIHSFIIIIFLTGFYGCVPSQPTEEFELLPSERLINRLEVNRRKIRNMEGNGTMFVKTPQLENSASYRVILQKPDSMQLSIMGPFGIELAEALVTGDEFIFYDALQNTAYTGETNSDALQNIFRIDLTFEDIMDAFVGSINLTENLYKTPDKYEVEYDKYVLTYNDPKKNITKRFKVDVRELAITDYEITSAEGDVNIVCKYSKFELIEGVAVPFKIDIFNKPQNQRVSIEYKKIVTNKNSIGIDFLLPDDATVISW